MKMILSLAWRNLWRNKRRSLITISSVLFAVLLAIIFYSLEQGSYNRMIDSMVRYSTGYLQIQDIYYEEEPSIDNSLLFDEQVEDVLQSHADHIAYYVPRIQSFALAATDAQTRGALVTGIDPERESLMNDLHDDLVDGSFLEKGDKDILIAEGLAGILKLGTGDSLILLGQGFQGTTAAGHYRIRGIVDLKVPEMNNNAIYLSLGQAQWFFGTGERLTSLIIMPHNPRHTEQLAAAIGADLDPEWYQVLTWKQMLRDLLALMQFDIAGTMVMIMILYVVITFGLFGTILTMMLERRREFGVLLSLGMKRSRLALVCFTESVLFTLTGVVAGMGVSLPILLYFYHNPIRLTGDMAETMIEYGFEPVMPFSLDPVVFLTQARIVLVISLLVGLYPVYKIFRMRVIDAKQ
jgi:ABC-type lipoprotein release transport system permease subunit